MILKWFLKKMKKASRPHPISHYGKRCLLKSQLHWRKGAAEPVDKGSCAARRTLSFSPLCSESHLLAFNSMNESTNRANFMVWLDNGSTGICCGKGRVEVTNQFHRKHQNTKRTPKQVQNMFYKAENDFKMFFTKKLKKASRPHPISRYGKKMPSKNYHRQ